MGLGNSLVNSRMRVPLPAARMTAFILSVRPLSVGQRTAWSESGAELVEHFGVGLHQAQQVLGLEDAQGTEVGARLGESFQLVRARVSRCKQNGLGMPGVAFDRARGGVIACNGKYIRPLAQQYGQSLIE